MKGLSKREIRELTRHARRSPLASKRRWPTTLKVFLGGTVAIAAMLLALVVVEAVSGSRPY